MTETATIRFPLPCGVLIDFSVVSKDETPAWSDLLSELRSKYFLRAQCAKSISDYNKEQNKKHFLN